tara:strand:- start:6490 stop:7026 length:537 start_codon:yes stop_codon:yes gene_type:complete
MDKKELYVKAVSKAASYTNIKMAKPVSLDIGKRLYDSTLRHTISKDSAYGESNSIKEFVHHFLSNGWKLYELERKYKALYIQAYFLLAACLLSLLFIVRYLLTSSIEPVSLTSAILFVAALAIKYLECICFMWRIRSGVINARSWPNIVMRNVGELKIQPLRGDYLTWLKRKYYEEPQ